MKLGKDALVSHYRIISPIGKGGMGEVYLAEDTKLGRKVALKILPAEFAADSDRMHRFVREAKSASALNHPNIITIHEIGEQNGTHFITTEFIDGKTLTEYLKANRLDYKSILDIAIQIVSALDEAHRAGIVHRDIKPDNVMIRANGLVKILDFGIAKLSAPEAINEDDATAIKGGTSPGMIIGTANYMSPEQAAGKAVDARSDIFSFGVVLYEMVSGRLPFAGETAMEMIGAILKDEPQPLGAGVPAELRKIVDECLKKNAGERYQSIANACEDLKEFKQELEFREKLERSAAPNRAENETQIFRINTTAEENQKTNPNSELRSPKSIVVLPFANIGASADDDYFSDGLTEEIISDLSKIRALRVISRNSAMRLKGTTKDLQTIARELGVCYILDGSVRKAGENLRISAQLIEAATDAVLWSEKFSGTLADVFEMQETVSHSIADALEITLTTGEIKQIEARPIADARAYDLYLRARANFQRGVPEALDRSIELLKQGLEIIGENDLLYAALGYAYYFYFRWISKLDENCLRLASECLQKTIAINPDSSHGFTLNGLLSYSRGQMAETIASLTRAVETDPANTEALLWLVVNLNYVGRGEESKQYAERLISIDPLTPINIFICGFAHVYSGEFDKFSPFLERALAVDSSSPLIIWSAVVLEAWGGNINKAIAHVDNLAELAPGWVYTEHALFLKHALRGENDIALTHYTPDFEKEAEYDCHFALHVAHCFALLGEKDKALDFLTLSVRKGMLNYSFIGKYDPLLENIRGEQRFKDLIEEAKRLSEQTYGKRGANSGFQNKPETGEALEAQTVMLSSGELRTEQPSDSKTLNENLKQEFQPTGKPKAESQNPKSKLWLFGLLGLLLLVSGFFGYKYLSPAKQIESIAVMPFVNESGNQDAEYLSDGMTETLINSLSQIPNLSVKARSSVFRYKGKEIEPKKIASELNVQAILNGRVTQRGDQLILNLELIDAQTENVIWSESYNRKQADLVSLQSEIARDVSGKLKTKLSGADQAKVTKTYTTDAEAYRLYLQGRFYWNKRGGREFNKAEGFFRQAVERDPNFALGYVGLADTDEDRDRPKKKEYILRALALDNSLAEAHASLGYQYMLDYDWAESERELKRAIELNPNYPQAYAWNGARLMMLGRYDESMAEIKRALELDPTAAGINFYYGVLLFVSGKPQESIRQFKKLAEMEPTLPWAHAWLSQIYRMQGNLPASVEERAVTLEIYDRPDDARAVRESFAKNGWNGFLRELIRQNEVKPEASRGLSSIFYAQLGENEKAINELTEAAKEGDFWLFRIRFDPAYDNLRGDDRFQKLLKILESPSP